MIHGAAEDYAASYAGPRAASAHDRRGGLVPRLRGRLLLRPAALGRVRAEGREDPTGPPGPVGLGGPPGDPLLPGPDRRTVSGPRPRGRAARSRDRRPRRYSPARR